TPPLEIRSDLTFRDAFCFEHLLKTRSNFLQGCSLGFAALAARGNIIANGVSVAGNRHRSIRFQNIAGELLAKLPNSHLHGPHLSASHGLYTSVPYVPT